MTTPHALATSTGSAESPPTFDGGLTAGDVERIATLINAELSAATRAAYASSWRNWEAWCRVRSVLPLPAAPEALAAYLTERAESGICYGTLDGACSAIAHRHHQDGLPDPTADPVVARVRRGLRRIMGTAPRRQAHPLTVAALRPSELAALDLADITVDRHGLLIAIRCSKTDQEGHGQPKGGPTRRVSLKLPAAAAFAAELARVVVDGQEAEWPRLVSNLDLRATSSAG